MIRSEIEAREMDGQRRGGWSSSRANRHNGSNRHHEEGEACERWMNDERGVPDIGLIDDRSILSLRSGVQAPVGVITSMPEPQTFGTRRGIRIV